MNDIMQNERNMFPESGLNRASRELEQDGAGDGDGLMETSAIAAVLLIVLALGSAMLGGHVHVHEAVMAMRYMAAA